LLVGRDPEVADEGVIHRHGVAEQGGNTRSAFWTRRSVQLGTYRALKASPARCGRHRRASPGGVPRITARAASRPCAPPAAHPPGVANRTPASMYRVRGPIPPGGP
jgi:hypothetical protein